MTTLPNVASFQLMVPGQYEDAFLYMGRLMAVASDGTLLQANLDRLVERLTAGSAEARLALMYLTHNELLESEGMVTLLQSPGVKQTLREIATNMRGELLADPDVWEPSFSLFDAFGGGALIDFQVYAQRLFAATTEGLHSVDLIEDVDELHFARPKKRSDARCISMAIRYGTVAASCEDAGLLVSYDEFSQLSNKDEWTLSLLDEQSIRVGWLGYHLVNYRQQHYAQAFRASYESVDSYLGNRRDVVITQLSADDALLKEEVAQWEGADFVYNAHASFFVHYEAGDYVNRKRLWQHGRLGGGIVELRGQMSRPLSALSVRAGIVLEHYDRVSLLSALGEETLHEGEAIVVRTFPSSVRYRNVVVVVDEEGIHIVSPVAEAVEARHR